MRKSDVPEKDPAERGTHRAWPLAGKDRASVTTWTGVGQLLPHRRAVGRWPRGVPI